MENNNETEDLENSFRDDGLISLWISGRQSMPDRIYDSALNSWEKMIVQYEFQFEEAMRQINLLDETGTVFNEALDNFIQTALPYKFFPMEENKKRKIEYLYVYALVHALIYDGIRKKDVSGIEQKVRNLIKKEDKYCKDKNIAFTNARILNLLLCKTPSLLLNVLNEIGIGDFWLKKTTEYIDRKEHRTYQKSLRENDWLFTARLIAYKDHYSLAEETEIVRAIVYTNGSSTLDRLKKELDEWGITVEKWEEIIQIEYNRLEKSSL